MRKIITTTFVTLDGVIQSPGGQTEDPSHGFKFGGWQMDWDDKDGDADKLMDTKILSQSFDLLLGRLTYNIWSDFWPKHIEEPRWGILFDKARKYVVSHNNIPLPWENSELITGDVVKEIKNLKNSEGPDLMVWGSGNLIQTLLRFDLIDKMHIWTFPITIGTGKKLFAEGTIPKRFKVVNSKVTSSGIVFATYEQINDLKSNF